MSFIIAVRMPTGRLAFIVEDDESPMEFGTEDAAYEFAKTVPLCLAYGCQVVEITN